MAHLYQTPEETLYKARDIALKSGLKFVYIGNLWVEKEENTYCPKCQKLLVGRSGFGILTNNIRHKKCPFCKQEIAGIWE
jgi:pyruvate formate lyase activating enzyme